MGSMPEVFGYEVTDSQAAATIERVFQGPINVLDTANNYGDGERRIGEAIRSRGGLPPGFVVMTKVDRGADDDFSACRVRESFEESLDRLGLDTVPVLFLHSPEFMRIPPSLAGAGVFEAATAPGGPLEGIVALKEEGRVAHLGISGGPAPLLERFVALDLFDAVLTHNRFTLVDRSSEPLIDLASRLGVGVLNGAVFGGGILVRGPASIRQYAYRPTPPAVIEAIEAMDDACRRHRVPLGAAALQFSTRDPRIASTVIGFSSPARISENLTLYETSVPPELWEELEQLVPPAGLWLDAGYPDGPASN